jgi:ornithine cyclodeaminase/alanine dehydrogenase-like protein (mu-crystallin family)
MHTTSDFLYLSDADLGAMNIAPSEVADAIETALIAKSEGRLLTSPKSALLPGVGRYMMSTLAVGDELIVVKQVTVSPGNPGRDLPAINGAIMVLDAETGLLRAVLGANWITAVRTAALSAVAARRLADPASESVGFVGSGVQARSHLEAFADMFPLKRVRVYGRGKANVDALCAFARGMGLEAEASESAEAALSQSDLIVTSVTLDYSITPFLDARWLKPNAFAAITDLCIPWIDESMGAFGTVVVDDRVQEAESDKPMVRPEAIAGDLTDLVAGGIEKRNDGRPSAFAFRGIALGDHAAAALVVRRAETLGLGQRVAP